MGTEATFFVVPTAISLTFYPLATTSFLQQLIRFLKEKTPSVYSSFDWKFKKYKSSSVKVTGKEGKNIDFFVGKILIYLLNINLQALNKM